MKTIPLTHNKQTIVDDEDFDFLNQFKWHLSTSGYARKNGKYGKDKMTYLHRLLITRVPKGKVVDHINRNKLDNRRCNLRIVNVSENIRNSNPHKDRKFCTVKGVTFNDNKWIARLWFNGKNLHLGSYSTLKDAQMAYKCVSKILL